MKLILSLLILLSLQVQGAECAKEIIQDYYLSEDVEFLTNSGATMNSQRVEAWEKFFEYPLDKECIEMMDVSTYKGKSGKIYVQLSTNDDVCDGGNVFGVVLNMDNEVVAEISDSEFYCPNEF